MRDRRSRERIIFEILSICVDGENVTKIVYRANTNFTTIKAYLNFLRKRELIECLEVSSRLYKTTEKGIDLMNRLEQLQQDLDELIV
jgi:predicted transcriptional regulator